MEKSTIKKSIFRLFAVWVILISGGYAHSGQGGVMQTIKNATAPFNSDQHLESILEPTDTVVPVKIRSQGGLFWTETRKDKIQRFRCGQCHNNTEVEIQQAAQMAHGDFVIDHGGREKPLSCFTCHKEDDLDFLETERGMKIDFDHSYNMCGQCHFRQKKDWVGGAHGRRISNWAGKRIVKNCTSCHDPHSPLFKKRWPKTYSPPFIK